MVPVRQRCSRPVLISHRSLGLVAMMLSALAAIMGTISAPFVLASAVERPYAILGLVFLASGLCGLAAALSFRGQHKTAYSILLFASCMATLNGVFVADFGVHAPVFYVGLIPLVLSFAVFGRHDALKWSWPIVLVWVIAFLAEFTLLGSSHPLMIRPPAVNVLINLFAIVISVAVIGYLLAKRAEEQLAASEENASVLGEQLQQADVLRKAREQFMAELAHEIRNPVAALRNAVTLMNHPRASQATKDRAMHLVDTTSANLLNLLNDALDAFKYGSQQFTLKQEPFDLAAVLNDVAHLYQSAVDAKGLTLRVDASCDPSASVVGDALRLQQMLSNLLGNAVKFTDSGNLTVRYFLHDAELAIWRFEVEDTGLGLTLEQQRNLFKPFAQVHGENAGSSKGTGLGLSIVAQLAEAMGGSAGVISELGRGSVFWFQVVLPRAGQAVQQLQLASVSRASNDDERPAQGESAHII